MPEPKTEIDDSPPPVGYSCHRCEEFGHGYQTCKRPGARTPQELDARINRILERWDAGHGEVKTWMKNEFIAAEKKAFEGKVKTK
jgi:hypothetical protein